MVNLLNRPQAGFVVSFVTVNTGPIVSEFAIHDKYTETPDISPFQRPRLIVDICLNLKLIINIYWLNVTIQTRA